MFIVVTVAITLVSLALIGIILMQQKNASGLGGGMSGMGSSAPTYWDKNKGNSLEGKLEKGTKICAALFFVLVILANIIA